MYFRSLGFMLLILAQVGYAQGRKPAVEDFVGIEVDHPTEAAPQGTESLFNFEKDITKFEKTKGQALNSAKTDTSINSAEKPGSLTTIFSVAFILGLPALIWFLMMNHLRAKAQIQGASNIEVLEKYRRQREEAKKAEKDFKKVS